MPIDTLSMQSVIQSALNRADKLYLDASQILYSDLPTRFPVEVAPETRLFLQTYADALGMSLASVCGLILDQTVSVSLKPSCED